MEGLLLPPTTPTFTEYAVFGLTPPQPTLVFPFNDMTFPFHVKAFHLNKRSYLMECLALAPSHGQVALVLEAHGVGVPRHLTWLGADAKGSIRWEHAPLKWKRHN